MSNPNVNVSCEKRRSQAGRADDNLLSLEKINFKTGDKLVSTQVKAYLQTERFRLKFYRKTSHCVGFGCVSFLGRISKGTPGRGPRLLMLFAIILAQKKYQTELTSTYSSWSSINTVSYDRPLGPRGRDTNQYIDQQYIDQYIDIGNININMGFCLGAISISI